MSPKLSSDDPGLFITGFPGFIGARLLERLIPLRPKAALFLLVQQRFVFQARQMCEAMERRLPALAGRWHIVVGDLRIPDLGLDAATLERVRAQVSEVWHLAAIYDLTVAQSIAYAVNVDGTEHVLDLCESLPNLRRLQYVSTCYVAGDRQGRVYEDELDCGQDFKNHYEATKFWAEVKVQRRMDRVPTSIYRPAIVVGDSKTGETAKGDGPYALVQLLLRLPRWLPWVNLGPSRAPVTLVPVDFVVDALAHLSCDDRAAGKVFQLADPSPVEAREIVQLTVEHLGRAPVIGALPVEAAALLRVPAIRRAARLSYESAAYFNHPVEFDVAHTAELLGDTLRCPRLPDYWPTLIDYASQHPEIFPTGGAEDGR